MEKDFWVCWILGQVFVPPLVDGMVFKGGTSLSKVYKAIDRFSEDVDLSLPREALGFTGEHDIQPGISRTKRDKLLTEMRKACEARVAGQLRHDLTTRVTEALGASSQAATWSVELDRGDAGTLLFAYPPALATELYGAGRYIRPVIRLEFGGRNEVWPAQIHAVQPYCLEVFPALSPTSSSAVNVLAGERTFWEKATLIHAEYHRPHASARPERVSRHYADLARLDHHEIGTRALQQVDLLRAVASHKGAYFPSKWARYDDAVNGSLHLVPHDALEHEVRSDYAAMREMFFNEPESFDDILAVLRNMESRVNTLIAGSV